MLILRPYRNFIDKKKKYLMGRIIRIQNMYAIFLTFINFWQYEKENDFLHMHFSWIWSIILWFIVLNLFRIKYNWWTTVLYPWTCCLRIVKYVWGIHDVDETPPSPKPWGLIYTRSRPYEKHPSQEFRTKSTALARLSFSLHPSATSDVTSVILKLMCLRKLTLTLVSPPRIFKGPQEDRALIGESGPGTWTRGSLERFFSTLAFEDKLL